IRRLRYKSGIGLLRTAFSIALIAGLVAEWAGYRNLSQFIVGGVVATLVIFLLVWLFTAVVNDVFNSLEEGRHPWEERLRKRLALREDGFVPGIFWLRVLVNVAVWASVAFALLRIWGLSARGQALLLHYLTHGFTLGKITIVPSRIALALLVLGVLLSLGSWARSALDQRLGHARMERGAREAAVAITGYLAAIVAGLVALSVAGFNFQNLALIAGALSVGIGFGLQNIVNNFVSGLILLFERPIRTGDWITVGQVEGFVRRISIRSTQIQTFDRADVVLPNSDLISGAVTNWMLRDTFGRVRVPVGVSYGTDPELVKETLLNVAHEHPHVIFDNSAIPNPYVLFMSFGDSSLNFELRVYIRDVNDKLLVLSDLNFAVDAAFRKAGITIPFPQRDIHIIRPSSDNTQDETPLPSTQETSTKPTPSSSGRPPPG
ncbi:mechanosensitive ion channel family protein, partial [Acidihalobacter prosperus]